MSLPLALAVEFCFGVLAELSTGLGEVGENLVAAESGAATGSGNDGLAFVGFHEAGGFENVGLLIGSDDDEPVHRLGDHRFVVGEYVTVTDEGGQPLTYRITEVQAA